MPAGPSRRPSHDGLVDAFLGDLAAAWAYSRHVHAGLTPYAFVLYGQESPTEFTAHVLTEEGLTAVARRYVERESYASLRIIPTENGNTTSRTWPVTSGRSASRSRTLIRANGAANQDNFRADCFRGSAVQK